MLVCAYTVRFGTRDRGCQSAPGFPCALWFEGEDKGICKPRAKPCRENADAYSLPTSSRTSERSERRSGTIRRGGCCWKMLVDGFASTITACGYGSLLSQGRR